MKKIFISLILGMILIPQLAGAIELSLIGEDPPKGPEFSLGVDLKLDGEMPNINTTQIDRLFKRENLYTDGQEKDKNLLKKLEGSKNETTFSDVYSGIAKLILGFATIMIFVGIVVAGAFLVMGQGEEGAVTKAKQIIMYIAIGVAILAASYAIVIGISRINPF